MSDIRPNFALNQKRLSVELSTMKLNLERMDLRLLELDDEKAKIEENKTQTHKRIEEINEQLLKTGGN